MPRSRWLRGLGSVGLCGRALAVLTVLGLTSCSGASDHRSTTVVDALVRADLTLIRNRPALVAAKYRTMAEEPFAYFRGSFPVFARDLLDGSPSMVPAGCDLPHVLVVGIGDAHLENFGTLRAQDGSFSLEPNDLDAAERYPYHWELLRLGTSLALATRLSSGEDVATGAAQPSAEAAIVDAGVRAYADELVRLADGGEPRRVLGGQGIPALEDLFARSIEGAEERSELAELTVQDGERRRLVRGAVDGEPTHVLRDLPPAAMLEVRASLEAYRMSLVLAPAASSLELLDAAQELGSGVASLPRVRVLALVAGATASSSDDVVLELKELSDAPARGWRSPGVLADDVESRIRTASTVLWSRPDADPTWSTATWLSLPVQVRQETDAHRTLRVRRLTGARATPEALVGLATVLGERLAGMHFRSPGGVEVADLVRPKIELFAVQMSEVARRYATTTLEDFEHFRRALDELGPLLGVRSLEEEPVVSTLRPLFEAP